MTPFGYVVAAIALVQLALFAYLFYELLKREKAMSNSVSDDQEAYPQLPELAAGHTRWRIFADNRTKVVYVGNNHDVARLIRNSGRIQLVPKGETMETMP